MQRRAMLLCERSSTPCCSMCGEGEVGRCDDCADGTHHGRSKDALVGCYDPAIVPPPGPNGNLPRCGFQIAACDTLWIMSLTLIVALPFAGALIAAFLPANA